MAEAVDGLLLDTVYSRPSPSHSQSVCVLSLTWLGKRVLVPSVTVTESLVQVTVVAGPPVEIQVRVN